MLFRENESFAFRLFFIALLLLAIGLPASKFLMSLGQFGVLAAWLINGQYRSSWKKFIQNKPLVVLSSLYLLHLIGALYTTDTEYLLFDLRIKLPILVLPFFSAPFLSLKQRHLYWFLHIFVASVFVVSLITFYRWFTHSKLPLSPFISHIRFGLMLVMSIFICTWFIAKNLIYRGVYIGLILWFLFVIYILSSLTAVILLISTTFLVLLFFPNKKIGFSKRLIIAVSFVLLLIVGGYITLIKPYFDNNKIKELPVKTYSANGEKYYNDLHFSKGMNYENGYYIWQNIAWNELKHSWETVSKVPFENVKFALVRYLTSMGLDKDAQSFKQLKTEDIKAVEQGLANVKYKEMSRFQRRVYETLWEIDAYRHHADPNDHSLVMRLIYWQTAIELWKQNPLFGVGTGDIHQEIKSYYELTESPLKSNNRRHSHNQFLTVLATFGGFGFVWFVIWIFYPFWLARPHTLIQQAFFFIALLSYLNEDTLETQAGVTFVMLFSTVLYSSKKVY